MASYAAQNKSPNSFLFSDVQSHSCDWLRPGSWIWGNPPHGSLNMITQLLHTASLESYKKKQHLNTSAVSSINLGSMHIHLFVRTFSLYMVLCTNTIRLLLYVAYTSKNCRRLSYDTHQCETTTTAIHFTTCIVTQSQAENALIHDGGAGRLDRSMFYVCLVSPWKA